MFSDNDVKSEKDVAEKLKPLFDQIWNAFDFEKTPYYDQDGNAI